MSDEANFDPGRKTENRSISVPPSSADGQIDRRRFLKTTAAGLLIGSFAGSGCAMEGRETDGSFQVGWPVGVDRYWLGPDYWTNPLQDWRLTEGHVEMIGSGQDRNIQLLTRRVGAKEGTLDLRVQTGFVASGSGCVGFEVGVQGPLREYRNNAIHGTGLKIGLTADNRIFIGETEAALDGQPGNEGVGVHLTAAPNGSGYTLALAVLDAASEEELGQLQRTDVSSSALEGNLALFTDFEDAADTDLQWGDPRLWIRSWEGEGTKLEVHDTHAFGPVLFSQYTLSRGTLKMTAQLPPMGRADGKVVRLQVEQEGQWKTVAEGPIDERARTATFRVENWDDTRDVPYRLVYRYRGPDGMVRHDYEGTVRRDPVDKEELVVGGFSCAKDTAFPHEEIAAGARAHDPDLLAFTGDQYYEDTGGYGVQRIRDNVEQAMLDVLRKWILHGWAFGDLTRDRPTICLIDDHDVYHGNIWGEGGKQVDQWELHDHGGYFMPPEWVNAVQRMQTSHLPDPYDPTPVRNGITVYYTDLVYGRVSFALLEDRKWKTGPDGFVPSNPGRPDHIENPAFDPADLDLPGAKLLGERQLTFLEEWAADWRGTDMKAVVSQTSFSQVPTHHGGNFKYLVADLDSNGWPQTPRNEALRRIRKGFAFHLGGDQHLPMLLRYGVDDWDDAPYNFCVPGIAVGYARAFWPTEEGVNPRTDVPYATGRYTDGLGNKMNVRAVANPKEDFAAQQPLQELANKSSGYGILRFNKASREITVECWPILSDPHQGSSGQYAGWPQTIGMMENYDRVPVAYLPSLSVTGGINPMVQVIDEEQDEVIYTLRIDGHNFRPKVFTDGPHTIRVGDDEEWLTTREGVRPVAETSTEVLEVSL